MLWCGELEFYDKAFDRITTKNPQKLRKTDKIFHTLSTSDDPVIRKVDLIILLFFLFVNYFLSKF